MSDHLRSETLTAGIERNGLIPAQAWFGAPFLSLHGMWHGAWARAGWPERFAERGREVPAISLPGHAASGRQNPVRFSTMAKHLDILERKIAKTVPRPIVIGPSISGASRHWSLRKRADNLRAAVLRASWTAQPTRGERPWARAHRDP